MNLLLESAKRALAAIENGESFRHLDEVIAPMLKKGIDSEADLVEEVRMLQEQNTELDKKLADYEQTSLELCEQCGWRFMLPGDGCLKCNAGPYKLSCGCKSKWLGLPAFWGTSSREGENAVAHGVVCERHWHEWGCWSPEMNDLNIIKRTLNDEIIADLWYKNGTHHHHFARAVERWLKGEE